MSKTVRAEFGAEPAIGVLDPACSSLLVGQILHPLIEFRQPFHRFGRQQIFTGTRPLLYQRKIDLGVRQAPALDALVCHHRSVGDVLHRRQINAVEDFAQLDGALRTDRRQFHRHDLRQVEGVNCLRYAAEDAVLFLAQAG